MPSLPTALTIAGSDPSGGAGIQADLKTFHQHGVYGMAAVSLITVQNTRSLSDVSMLKPELVAAQIQAVLEDIPPQAIKSGALGNEEIVFAVADAAKRFACPYVLDPVMISKHKTALLAEAAQKALIKHLLPHALLVTPNIPEAEALSGLQIEDDSSLLKAASAISAHGPKYVLIKGGHLENEEEAVDVLWSTDLVQKFSMPRLETQNTHGTGCVLSAAITSRLAKGEPVAEAVKNAKAFVNEAIRTNPGLGRGAQENDPSAAGPVNLHATAE